MRVIATCFLAALALLSLVASASADSIRMWEFADQRASELNRFWSDEEQRYVPPGNPVHINASLLSLHARAQLAHHAGAARQDDRIQPLAARLSSWPVYISDPAEARGEHPHAPGFTAAFVRPSSQHVSFDMQIMNALALAVTTGLLAPELEQRVRVRMQAVAKQKVFRYPFLALNQMNWPLQVQVAAARVSGQWSQAAREARRQLLRWGDGMRRPMSGQLSPNLSSGLGLFYFPQRSRRDPMNRVSNTEYANIIYAGLDVYDDLLAHGMPRLSRAREARLRAWARRLLRGEWTHGGWPNWDTGYGLKRWQLLRYWAWSAEALATMAASPLATAADRASASWLFERVLDRYDWLAERGPLSGTRYGVRNSEEHPADAELAGARLAATAARAAASQMATPVPPAGWSWWDPELRRLAVSSPRYSAVIVKPISTPRYGGLEPARFLDSQGRVLTSLGADGQQSGLTAIRHGRSIATTQARGSTAFPLLSSWRVAGEGSAHPRLAGRNGSVEVLQRFVDDGLTTTYRLPGRAAIRLKLPIWGSLEKRLWRREGRDRVLQTQNDEGARLRMRLTVPAKARLSWRRLPHSAASPRTRMTLVARWYQRYPGRARVQFSTDS